MTRPYEPLPELPLPDTRRNAWAARASIVAMAGLLGVALVAAAFVRVDRVVTAPMELRPAGEAGVVAATYAGRLQQLLARPQQRVSRGQVLARMDTENLRIQRNTVAEELANCRHKVQAIAEAIEKRRVGGALAAELAELEGAVNEHRRRDRERRARALSRASGLNRRQRERAERLVGSGAVASSELETLAAKQWITRSEVLQARDEAAALQAKTGRGGELARALRGAEQDIAVAELELARAEAEGAALRTQRELQELNAKIVASELRAPVDGVVTDLRIRHAGEVLGSGERFCLVVPDQELRIVAQASSESIGFVSESQRVRFHFDAYPATEFGSGVGKVTSVAEDRDGEAGAYRVEARVTRLPSQRSGQAVPVRPGLQGTAEFVVGREALLLALVRPARGRIETLPR